MKNFFSALGIIFSLFLVMMAIGFFALVKGLDANTITDLSATKDNSVGIVDLKGEINNSYEFREKLDKFVQDKSIKAIVIAIDSPGGAVGASEEIYRYILEARSKKPVVCSLGNMAASGGLYSSLGCQKVITQAGTLTGSIGVIMMLPNVSSIMEKVGVQFHIIKTGQFKDTGTPFRDLTESDRNFLHSVASQAYEQFIDAVSTARNIPKEKVREFADGRIILGETSVKLGLADKIGTLKDAARESLSLVPGYDATKAVEPSLVFPTKKMKFAEFLENVNGEASVPFIPQKFQSMSIRYQLM